MNQYEQNSTLVLDQDDDSSEGYLSASPPILESEINFQYFHALKTFTATEEGQANVVKGDVLLLINDTNSYWWLVKLVKDSSVGFLPAENIETPTERLARLNKHRNVTTTGFDSDGDSDEELNDYTDMRQEMVKARMLKMQQSKQSLRASNIGSLSAKKKSVSFNTTTHYVSASEFSETDSDEHAIYTEDDEDEMSSDQQELLVQKHPQHQNQQQHLVVHTVEVHEPDELEFQERLTQISPTTNSDMLTSDTNSSEQPSKRSMFSSFMSHRKQSSSSSIDSVKRRSLLSSTKSSTENLKSSPQSGTFTNILKRLSTSSQRRQSTASLAQSETDTELDTDAGPNNRVVLEPPLEHIPESQTVIVDADPVQFIHEPREPVQFAQGRTEAMDEASEDRRGLLDDGSMSDHPVNKENSEPSGTKYKLYEANTAPLATPARQSRQQEELEAVPSPYHGEMSATTPTTIPERAAAHRLAGHLSETDDETTSNSLSDNEISSSLIDSLESPSSASNLESLSSLTSMSKLHPDIVPIFQETTIRLDQINEKLNTLLSTYSITRASASTAPLREAPSSGSIIY